MATYHVSKHASASDSNSGADDTTNAWSTITASVAKLSPGDILEIHVGTYAESVVPGGAGGISWVSGSSGSHITIRAFGHTDTTTKGVSAGTDAVVIKPNSGSCVSYNKNDFKYVDFSGLVLDGANAADSRGISANNDANNITWRNFVVMNIAHDGLEGSTSNGSATTDRVLVFMYGSVSNCGTLHSGVDKHGCYWRSRGAIFDHLDVFNNDVSGFQFYNSGTSARYAHNCIVRHCIIRDNATEYHGQQVGISIGPNMDNFKCHNNLIYNHRDAGIDLSTLAGNSTDHKIYNNTIVDIGNGGGNGKNGIRAAVTGHSGVQVKNNLIWDTVGDAIVDTYGLLTTSNNWLATSNPNFTGYTRGSAWDLTLSGSTPGTILTGGLDLGSEYYDDFAGTTRSGTFSIGAYASGIAPDPPEDPVLTFPAPFLVTVNTPKLLDGFGIADINDPDVGNYTFDAAVTEGALNDGV